MLIAPDPEFSTFIPRPSAVTAPDVFTVTVPPLPFAKIAELFTAETVPLVVTVTVPVPVFDA